MPEPRLIPIVELTTVRLREFLREPEAVFWVFAFPLLMAFALGIAFREERAQEVVVGVVRAEGSTIGQQLKGAEGVRVRPLEPGDVDGALRRGQVAVVLMPGPPLVYRFDPARPESRMARLVVDDVLQRKAGRAAAHRRPRRQRRGAGLALHRLADPGAAGMNIMGTSLWSIGFSVVEARSRKLLKRLMATPMPRGAVPARRTCCRGWSSWCSRRRRCSSSPDFAFGVAPVGSIALVAGLILLGALAFSGLGLLIATRATTIEGVSGWMNIVMMPMWLLSGVFFASSNFPDVAQPFIRLLPLTALVDALRGVFLDGYGPAAIGREIATLTIYTVATFVLSMKLFRWR